MSSVIIWNSCVQLPRFPIQRTVVRPWQTAFVVGFGHAGILLIRYNYCLTHFSKVWSRWERASWLMPVTCHRRMIRHRWSQREENEVNLMKIFIGEIDVVIPRGVNEEGKGGGMSLVPEETCRYVVHPSCIALHWSRILLGKENERGDTDLILSETTSLACSSWSTRVLISFFSLKLFHSALTHSKSNSSGCVPFDRSRENDDTKQFVVGQFACFSSSRHLMSTASTLSLSLRRCQWSARNEQHTCETGLISAWAQVRVDRSASLLDWRCPHVIACRQGEHIQQDNSASFISVSEQINVRSLFRAKEENQLSKVSTRGESWRDDVWTRQSGCRSPKERYLCTSRFISSVSILFITLMTKWWDALQWDFN